MIGKTKKGFPVHPNPIVPQDKLPMLVANLTPPEIHGMAELAHRAYAGASLCELLAFVRRPARDQAEEAAMALDASLAHRMHFEARAADALQALALAQCAVFRIKPDAGAARASKRTLRVLALAAPGDLMVNTPIGFITRYIDVRLDVLFVRPGCPLPQCLPDHDVAFFAVSESDPSTLARLLPLFAAWPRPVLNDPAAIARLSRDVVARGLAGLAGIHAPATRRLERAALDGLSLERPLLVRPVGTHAGEGLDMIEHDRDLAAYLQTTDAAEFFVTEFVDYRGPDGMFRKYRVVFVDGEPLLCHMAVSRHWMVHYLNAEMTQNADRRAEEAQAMRDFEAGFARRHQAAFAALNGWMGLDYHQIDCAETQDGRLLVFEVDTAAIVHLMDPPDLFPYKAPQMRRVFNAFAAMLRRAAATRHGRYDTSMAMSGGMG